MPFNFKNANVGVRENRLGSKRSHTALNAVLSRIANAALANPVLAFRVALWTSSSVSAMWLSSITLQPVALRLHKVKMSNSANSPNALMKRQIPFTSART